MPLSDETAFPGTLNHLSEVAPSLGAFAPHGLEAKACPPLKGRPAAWPVSHRGN